MCVLCCLSLLSKVSTCRADSLSRREGRIAAPSPTPDELAARCSSVSRELASLFFLSRALSCVTTREAVPQMELGSHIKHKFKSNLIWGRISRFIFEATRMEREREAPYVGVATATYLIIERVGRVRNTRYVWMSKGRRLGRY